MMLRYILLDVHGVLTDGQERKRFLSYMEKVWKADYDVHNSLWVKHIGDLDRGTESAIDYIKIINKTFNTNFSPEEYYSIFLRMIKINEGLINRINGVKNDKVCIVSDNLPQIATGLDEKLGNSFRNYRKFYSFEFGYTKLDGMLKIALKELDVRPNECLFIDDNSGNVVAAKELGMNAVVFRDNKGLFNEFKKYDFE